MKQHVILIAGLLLIVLPSAGCVERTISITSDPSGALVYLNDQEVGRTPVTTPFMWYGTYDVRLEADGHKPLWTTAKADQPIWDLPGFDLFAEAIPDAKSEVKWHFEMEPASLADREELLNRAKDLRREVVVLGEPADEPVDETGDQPGDEPGDEPAGDAADAPEGDPPHDPVEADAKDAPAEDADTAGK